MRVFLACAAVLLLATPANSIGLRPRVDLDGPVGSGHWAYDAFAYLITRDVFSGHDVEYVYSYERFGPIQLTRQQFADAITWAIDNLDCAGYPRSSGDDPDKLHIYAMLIDLERAFLPRQECNYELYPPAQRAKNSRAYEELPLGHWANDVFHHFQEIGLLEGYPDDYFQSDSPKTAYDFCMALARLRDAVDQQGCTGPEFHLLKALRAEFYPTGMTDVY